MINIELDKNKMYYSIGEVSKIFDVNASLIRFWEKEFKQLSPKKAESGKRKFTEKDIKNIQVIYHLVKEKGYTLDGAKSYLKTSKNEINKIVEIELKLNNIKTTLAQLLES
jgi:DNA-binding transcriptional MerR regulator|tara:strand:+ start:622 stop:954 length:333 start_codon:yes stop_codon:yes gene_type:complete